MTKAGYQAGSCGSLRKSGIKHRLGQKTQHKSARLCRINPSLLASEHTVLCAHGLPGGKQGAGLNGEQNGNLQCEYEPGKETPSRSDISVSTAF